MHCFAILRFQISYKCVKIHCPVTSLKSSISARFQARLFLKDLRDEQDWSAGARAHAHRCAYSRCIGAYMRVGGAATLGGGVTAGP